MKKLCQNIFNDVNLGKKNADVVLKHRRKFLQVSNELKPSEFLAFYVGIASETFIL